MTISFNAAPHANPYAKPQARFGFSMRMGQGTGTGDDADAEQLRKQAIVAVKGAMNVSMKEAEELYGKMGDSDLEIINRYKNPKGYGNKKEVMGTAGDKTEETELSLEDQLKLLKAGKIKGSINYKG